MKSEVETITPATAQRYLLKNSPRNRPLRSSRVAELSRDILRGDWRLSHQPIAFDTDGNLIDGQHRLNAIIQTGISLQVMVTRGVDPESFDVIDRGLKRSAGDVLGIHGDQASTMGFLAKILLSENPSIQMIGSTNQFFGPLYSDLISHCGSSSKIFSSSPVRAAAITSMKLRPKATDFVLDSYRNLVARNYPSLTVSAAAFMKQMETSDRIRIRGSVPLFIRSMAVFNPAKKEIVKTQVNTLPGGGYTVLEDLRSRWVELIQNIREGCVA